MDAGFLLRASFRLQSHFQEMAQSLRPPPISSEREAVHLPGPGMRARFHAEEQPEQAHAHTRKKEGPLPKVLSLRDHCLQGPSPRALPSSPRRLLRLRSRGEGRE